MKTLARFLAPVLSVLSSRIALEVVLFLYPAITWAGVIADSVGISSAITESKVDVLAVGSIVIVFVAFLAVVPTLIRLVKMADPSVTALSNARVSFDGFKDFTTSPNARYGASYKRQGYENHTVDSLYSHVEFLEFSARLHERELEFLMLQQSEAKGQPEECLYDDAIAEANAKIAEFEAEQEFFAQQIEIMVIDESSDIADDEFVDESVVEDPVDYSNPEIERLNLLLLDLDAQKDCVLQIMFDCRVKLDLLLNADLEQHSDADIDAGIFLHNEEIMHCESRLIEIDEEIASAVNQINELI